MNAVQFLRDGYRDSSFATIKEWANERGTIGVYRSEAYGYVYLLALLDAEHRVYYSQQYGEFVPLQIPLQEAETLARFADAKERMSE